MMVSWQFEGGKFPLSHPREDKKKGLLTWRAISRGSRDITVRLRSDLGRMGAGILSSFSLFKVEDLGSLAGGARALSMWGTALGRCCFTSLVTKSRSVFRSDSSFWKSSVSAWIH